ncbi:MAG: hypothetical protein KJ065_27630 [Anaerolineae bacterium]|nr:hypothetical protein [Anaerolineae bacterium]
MLKRLGLALGLLAIFFLLAAPMIVTAQEEAYAEGIYFSTFFGPPSASSQIGFSLRATKQVDGDWSQTTIIISMGGHRVRYRTYTGVLDGDPDGLEVSEDLGWGGLDGQAMLVDSGTGIAYLFEFHLQSVASESAYTENPTNWYFERPSVVEGVILVDGVVTYQFPVGGTYAHAVYGINFSDQWPGY